MSVENITDNMKEQMGDSYFGDLWMSVIVNMNAYRVMFMGTGYEVYDTDMNMVNEQVSLQVMEFLNE